MNVMIGWILYGLGTYLVAEHLGRKRKMGYGQSLFWCLLLSPILGVWIVLMSPRLSEQNLSSPVETGL